jgi:putative endonuclease
MYFVYVLRSRTDYKYYTGYTDELEQRIKRHEHGYVLSTRNRRPLDLIYYEAYIDKRDALGREQFLKSGPGHRYLEKQLKHFLELETRGPYNSLRSSRASAISGEQ